MSNIEQNICEAVDIIVNRALSQAQFDKTIKATIVNLVDNKTGKYKVRYQDDLIYAYAGTADMDFNTGDEVYILVPQGNFSGDKTILGTTKKIGGAAGDEYVLPENERYEIVGNNVFTEGATFRFRSYDSYQKRRPITITPGQYNAETGEWSGETTIESEIPGAAPETFNIDAAAFSHYIKMADYLVLSAKIATNLPEKQQYQGNYGFEVCLRFSTAEDGVFEDKIYRIDVNNIQGFPWGLGVDGIQQYFYFDIPSDKFVSIQYVQLFAENFPAEPEEGVTYDWDIWIKDLSMTAANRISDDDLDSYFVRLITENGTNFTRTNTSDKTIEAFVYEKGRDITTNSKLKYYWFYQRADVTTSHPNYCSYGGEGWYCLNKIVEVKDEEQNVIRKTWQPATNKHIVKKAVSQQNEDFIFSELKDNKDDIEKSYIINQNKIYKCVVLYDNTIIEKQVIFTRDDVEWSIALATTTGETTFYRDEGSTQINCTIYDNLEPYLDYENCTFKWMTINYLNSATLNESQTRTLDVKISSITYSSTYLCSAFINNEYIGTESITLTNTGEDLNLPLYELMMINNSQLFKYDEDGISPTSTAQENPETALPLLLSIFDNKRGMQLDIGNGAAANVTIYVPNHHTLIVPKSGKERTEGEYDIYKYPSTGFAFDIKDKYNPSYKNNTIKVVAIYNKITLVGYTNFTFIKEGEDGTNGTRYVCRIVPNLKTGDNSYREWVAWTNNEDGSRSYNFEPDSESNPFRAVLLDGNTEVEDILTAWSALFRKYSSSEQENSLIGLDPFDSGSSKLGYLGMSSKGKPPASILKATVSYEGGTYYATLPIVDIQRKNFNYNFTINDGLHDVVYSADGTNPKYDNSTPFSITVTDLDGNIVTDVNYQWSILGKVREKRDAVDAWYDAELLNPDHNYQTGTGTTYLVRPSSKYDGLCLSTGVQCIITDASGIELATIIIPIHFYLNRFGHAAINAWDGNSIEIDKDEGIILTPQVGAGHKDGSNAFTGMVMGEIKYGTSSKTGLVGYNKGSETMFLSAEDGSATFGQVENGQIHIRPGYVIIDENGNKVAGDAIIEGGKYNYNENGNGSGLQINLSEPSIKYGSGKFKVDKNGILSAKGAKIEGSFQANGELGDVFQVKVPYHDDNGYLKYTQIYFSDNSAYIQGNSLDIDFNRGTIKASKYNDDGYEVKAEIFPGSFYFGCQTYLVGEEEKGGYIKWSNDKLEISGGFNADWGSIGGWEIKENELSAKGKLIRLFSGDDSDPDNPIPAFITVGGDKAEISSIGDGEKATLRKGGLYLYTNTTSPDSDSWKPGEWDGAIYTNSRYDDALTFVTQGTKPMYFFGNNLEGAKDSLVMRIQPGLTADSKYVRIGYSGSSDEKMTTLYPNKISVKDIDILAPLDTKAKTVAGAINEIYPGGPVNIQHATVVLPENKIDILYDYNVVMHTHSNEVGYGPQNASIYVQGLKIGTQPTSGVRYWDVDLNNDGYYDYCDWNFLKSLYPFVEWYNSVTGKFYCYSRIGGSDAPDVHYWADSIASFHYSTELEGITDETRTCKITYQINGGEHELWASVERPISLYQRARPGFNPGTSKFYFTWDSIISPGSNNEQDYFGYGYVVGYVRTFIFSENDHIADDGERYWSCSLENYATYMNCYSPVTFPFASQAEYEAAVNLISVDQKLYEIEQNKSTSS